MKTIMLIGAAACATAMADETYSTFGEDWNFSLPWLVVGQTMNSPDEATILESFDFLGEVGIESIHYSLSVYRWDTEGQHVIGDPLFLEYALMLNGDDSLRQHDIGLLLPPNEKIAVIVSFENIFQAGNGIGVASDVWSGGSAIATYFGAYEDPWVIYEGTSNDMIFKAEWTVCEADVYQDGMLNIFDFLAFQGLYNNGDAKADFNGDGVTNILDFVAFQSAFLAGCS